jgi:hypothetical protein
MASSKAWVGRLLRRPAWPIYFPKDCMIKINHFTVSVAKSILRIGAGAALVLSMFIAAGLLLVVAEVLGILEEVVDYE